MSTTEYVAVVLLVSIVLAVGGAQIAGVDIADAVTRKIKVALCVVAGDDCDESGEERACVVSSVAEGEKDEVLAVVGSAENGYVITRERLSNGRYRVHMTHRTGGSAGRKLEVKTNIAGLDVDAALDAEVAGAYTYGQTFEVGSAAEADALAKRLRDADHDVLRVLGGAIDAFTGDDNGATEQFIEVENDRQAGLTVGALGLKPAAAALVQGKGAGFRRYHRSREFGLYLTRDITASGGLDAALASAGLAFGGDVQAELVLSNGFAPRALVVRGSGSASAKAQAGGPDPMGGNVAEFEARLDLTKPPLDEPARRLLDGDLAAFPQLVRALPTAARVDVRNYREDRKEDSSGPNLLGAGFKTTKSTDTSKLTSAYTHQPGTSWLDWKQVCVA